MVAEAVQPDRLRDALAAVMAVDEDAGREPRRSLVRLASDDAELDRLAGDALDPGWRPRPLVSVEIPKGSGGVRRLGLPCARERVLERAILEVLEPVVDPHLGGASFAYRSGVGVGDALRRVVALRDEGFGHVVRTDIDDCFPSIDRARLVRLLSSLVGGDPVVDLVGRLIARRYREGRFLRHRTGIPQGSSLSPLLSNLYLVAFDDAVQNAGFPLVRYADDCVVFASNQHEGALAMDAAERAADSIGLDLGADKTELLDFTTGFSFLGEDVNHRYPPSGPDPVEVPSRRVLYVGVQGAYVAERRGRVVVSRKKVSLLDVPKERVERVVAFGSVTMSPGFRDFALNNDVDVVYCSRSGRLNGWLRGTGDSHVSRRRAQYVASADEAVARELATEMVAAKLHNQKVLLRRYVGRTVADDLAEIVAEIDGYAASLPSADSAAQALGVEGIVARRYFEGVGLLIPDDVGFAGRSTRPPADVVNAALSYGYAILTGEATTACAAAGLDPECGFLHTDRNRRPSLALDLIEEFRPVVVDAAVMALVRRGALPPERGRPADGGRGVWLTEEGRRVVTAAIERRLLTRVYHPVADRRVALRWAIFLQARQVAGVVDRRAPYVAYRRRV